MLQAVTQGCSPCTTNAGRADVGGSPVQDPVTAHAGLPESRLNAVPLCSVLLATAHSARYTQTGE